MPSRTRSSRLPSLLPTPRRAEARAGAFRLRDGQPIVLPPRADDADFRAARALRDALAERCGVALAIEGHAESAGLGPHLELIREGGAVGLEGDAHRVTVAADRVVAAGSGAAGLRYAVETLSQLATASSRIPCCRIDDAPDLELRGIMLDVSRCKVPTLATAKQLVDLCLRLKLNVLMLYIEHTFRFRRHPQIGADASPLEAEELRELDAYAAERHVDLIPCLQSLGHMEHVLKLPRYRALSETSMGWTISPADPGTHTLLAELYGEFLPNFRSRWFNANCDEPYDVAKGRSAAREAELGPGGVFLEHVEKVRKLAREHGKQTMVWADVVHGHTDRLPELNRELVLLDWWYEAELDFDRVRVFAEHGLQFLVCPGTSSWNCLFPRVENSLRNIERYAAAGKRHGARGLLVTDWGDFGHYNLQGNSWLAFAWAAQHAWSGAPEERAFDRAFSRHVLGDERGVAAKLYRELGALHDAGFPAPNASCVQFLYFDDLGPGFFTQQARPAKVSRLRRRIAALLPRLEAAEEAFVRDPLTHEELLHAARATDLALRKTEAGQAYLAWRRDPQQLDARARRRLARTLAALADEQREQARTLRRLWLARSKPSNFEHVKGRLDRSVRSLARASRALASGRAPAAPPAPGAFEFKNLLPFLRNQA